MVAGDGLPFVDHFSTCSISISISYPGMVHLTVISSIMLVTVCVYLENVTSYQQRCKLCGLMGRSCPVGLGTSSRILRRSQAVFVLSRNFAVTYALVGYFWANLPDFQHFSIDFGNFWAILWNIFYPHLSVGFQ